MTDHGIDLCDQGTAAMLLALATPVAADQALWLFQTPRAVFPPQQESYGIWVPWHSRRRKKPARSLSDPSAVAVAGHSAGYYERPN